MNDITVQTVDDGTLVVDSRLIAERLGITHKAFLKTIDKYSTKMAESTVIKPPAFKNSVVNRPQGGGTEERWALLTEPQANFLMSISRNTDKVVQCKINLVEAFEKAKKLLQQQVVDQQPTRGYWYERQLQFIKHNTIPAGYFCIFQKMHHFIWELENAGYVIPEVSPQLGSRMLPDISVGLLFCKHLRSQGMDVDAIVKKYPHRYPDRPTLPVEANIYPDSVLPEYRRWFLGVWKEQRSLGYFEERDHVALPPLHDVLHLPFICQLELLLEGGELRLLPTSA